MNKTSELNQLLRDFQLAREKLSDALGDEVDAVLLPSGEFHLTERAQLNVQKENALLLSVLDSLPAHIALLDRSGRIVSVNRAWKAFAMANGCRSANHGVGLDYLRICQTAAPRVEQGIRRLLNGELAIFEHDYRMISPCGAVSHFRLTVTPTTEGAVVSHLDRTADRRAQESLLASEERFRLVSHATQDVIWDWDLSTDEVYWNEKAVTMFGYSAQEMASWNNETRLQKIHPDDRERFRRGCVKALKGQKNSWSEQYRFQKNDGTYLHVFARGTIIRDREGKAIRAVGCKTDLTEAKQLQEQLLRSQRLESIGTLSSGIAHDLNNILSPILVAAEFLKEDELSASSEELVETILTSATRGAALIKQILTFAKGSDGVKKFVNLHQLSLEVKTLVDDTFPRGIRTELVACPEPWGVLGEANRLHQVILNMCVNARDAMPQGGKLTISIDNKELDFQSPSGQKSGSYVRLSVKDEGEGIAKELQSKIFDPFFTTKETGKGTGLGLSTAFSIVNEHGGFIGLESEVRRGSEFIVYLPALAVSQEKEQQTESRLSAQGEDRLVLLVDDEVSIRRVARRALERNGYRVLEAADGVEALAVYGSHKNHISLVVTDMSMPEMSGTELAGRLRTLDPELRILATSGRPPGETIGSVIDCFSDFLPKPYTVSDLLNSIDHVISNHPSQASGAA